MSETFGSDLGYVCIHIWDANSSFLQLCASHMNPSVIAACNCAMNHTQDEGCVICAYFTGSFCCHQLTAPAFAAVHSLL